MRQSLAANHSEELVTVVLSRLIEQRIMDDLRLVKRMIAQNVGKGATSVALLRRRCAERGADPSALEPFNWADEPALAPILERFRGGPGDRARAYRLLASREFDEDAIAGALKMRFGDE